MLLCRLRDILAFYFSNKKLRTPSPRKAGGYTRLISTAKMTTDCAHTTVERYPGHIRETTTRSTSLDRVNHNTCLKCLFFSIACSSCHPLPWEEEAKRVKKAKETDDAPSQLIAHLFRSDIRRPFSVKVRAHVGRRASVAAATWPRQRRKSAGSAAAPASTCSGSSICSAACQASSAFSSQRISASPVPEQVTTTAMPGFCSSGCRVTAMAMTPAVSLNTRVSI